MAFLKYNVTLPAAVTGAFLLLWQGGSYFYTPVLLPSPVDVVKAIAELASDGVLAEHIFVSLKRFFTAYLMAAVSGVVFGVLLGYYPLSKRAFDPLIQVLRPISPIAWFPLAVLWFGIGDAPAVFIIYLSAFFPILLSSADTVRNIPRLYFKVSENFGAGKRLTFFKVVLPAAFPGIMVGLHIAVGTAWIHLVAGEMLGAQSGLGYLIVDARNFMRTDWVIAGMTIVGCLGLAIYKGMKVVENLIKFRLGAENI